jgi:hypothetical protein
MAFIEGLHHHFPQDSRVSKRNNFLNGIKNTAKNTALETKEAFSQALHSDQVSWALKSKACAIVIATGLLSTSVDTTIGLHRMQNFDFQAMGDSALHIATELVPTLYLADARIKTKANEKERETEGSLESELIEKKEFYLYSTQKLTEEGPEQEK